MVYYMPDDEGNIFRMGVNVEEVANGDAVKVNGKLERILSIERVVGSKWNRTIRTSSGSYQMMDVQSYGKKVD